MEQLIQQVQLLTQKVTEQDAMLNVATANTTRFQLSASQVIKNFNDIKSFSGEDSYKVKSFFKAIENAEELCGTQNQELRSYCLRMMINSKIIGKARNAILEIPENQRNWTTVKRTLVLRFRPKFTVHQLLFDAKGIKVFNLKDLFNKLTTVKSDISEVCDFDDDSVFTYQSVDRELVLILKSKVIPLLQFQIDETKTLFELDNHFCKSEIYLSGDVIKPSYKLRFEEHTKPDNSMRNSKFDKNKGHTKPFEKKKQFDYKPNPNRSDGLGSGRYNQNKFSGNSGQYRKNFHTYEPKVENMEIDNLVEIQGEGDDSEIVREEVNFH